MAIKIYNFNFLDVKQLNKFDIQLKRYIFFYKMMRICFIDGAGVCLCRVARLLRAFAY